MSEKNHALGNANGWMETILEQAGMLNDEKKTDEERDGVRETIQESVLSVEVRSGWYSPGSEGNKAEEFNILLSWGGPAARIIGDLDEYRQPLSPRLQYQDWGTPWTDKYCTEEEEAALLVWCNVFYFGE